MTARLVHSDPTSIIHVSWDIPVVSNKTEIQGYSVNYREKRTGGNVKNQVVFDKEATLKDLFGGTQYIIYVRLYTACGISDPSEHYEITTKEGRPRIPPARIRALNIGNQTLRLTWSPISRTYSNGRITFYSIYYGKIGSSVKKELHLPGNSTETVINSGLRDGEYCEIEMAARTVVGYGPKSNSVLVKIGSPADPGKNRILTYFNPGSVESIGGETC